MKEKAIIARNISKEYHLYASARDKYKDFFLPGTGGTSFFALRDITFSLEGGQSLGLIGLNGSGKTTLANVIAGASAPTSGRINARGQVSMISVTSGVNIALTGRENIMLKGLLQGLSKQQILERMPEIIEFSELEDVIDQQVKTYSSGMRSKLGFAVSVNIDPDVLIIDEALSVGDPTFTRKCLVKMQDFRKKGKTIVFVSHSLPQVKDFCDQAMWLEGGQLVNMGECAQVCDEYAAFIKRFNGMSSGEQKAYKQQIREKQVGESSGQKEKKKRL